MSAVSARWRSWDDVPVSLGSGQVMIILGLGSRNTLQKLVDGGALVRSKKIVGQGYKYSRASVREYCAKQGYHPFDDIRTEEA